MDMYDTWNELVRSNITVGDRPVDMHGSANKFIEGDQIEWAIYARNISKNVEYPIFSKVVIRVVGDPECFDFYSDSSYEIKLAPDYRGNPRIHVSLGQLRPGEEKSATIYIVAKRNFRNIRLNLGVYADIRPYGHYWISKGREPEFF